jgi:hypothetical protein
MYRTSKLDIFLPLVIILFRRIREKRKKKRQGERCIGCKRKRERAQKKNRKKKKERTKAKLSFAFFFVLCIASSIDEALLRLIALSSLTYRQQQLLAYTVFVLSNEEEFRLKKNFFK